MKSTVDGQIRSMQSVSEVIAPTMPLTDAETMHFDRIVTSREADSWAPHDLTIACNLAKALAVLDTIFDGLAADGLTQVNERGTRIANPLLSCSVSVAGSVRSLSAALGLTASQRGMASEPQRKRNAADREARKALDRAAQEEDLL